MKFRSLYLRSILYTLYSIILMSGCASIKETAKGFVGISTKALEDARKDAKAQSFNYDYSTCYTKTLDALKLIDAYIYAKDEKKQMIAIYVSAQDTTPVGIFFKQADASHTQIEVSSQSKYAKERVSKRLFAILDGLPDPEAKKEEESDK